MASNTPIKVCTNACILAGIDPIQSFYDGTRESEVCDALYEDTARAALASHPWRFAVEQAVLNRLLPSPTGRWDAAYQFPANALKLRAVTINDNRIEYDVYSDKIFCNASANEEVIADYIYRADEADWLPHFTLYVELRMATFLAISVARDNGLMQMLDQQANRQLIAARHTDSAQQTTRKLTTSKFIANRRT